MAITSSADKRTAPVLPEPSPEIPRRHGRDLQRARHVAARIVRIARGPETVDGERWALLGRGLMLADEPADAVARYILEHGHQEGRTAFERALELGIDAVPDAAPELRAFFDHVEARPPWVRDELLCEGAEICGLGGVAAAHALLVNGLLAGYELSEVNRTLLATGLLENGTARRIAETYQFWFDVTSIGGMSRFGNGFKSTLRVRLIHAFVRAHLLRAWDTAESGVPVSQTDMQATLLGFSLVYLLGMRMLGIPLKHTEREAVMHLWRYVGWLSGVDERFLPDLDNGFDSAAHLLYLNLLGQVMGDEHSPRLARALVDEPLQRKYPRFAKLRGLLTREIELSIARVSLSSDTLRRFDLPRNRLPWYPLSMFLYHQLVHQSVRRLPGGRSLLARRGRAQQARVLDVVLAR